jgi:tRNA U34 5-methylaminomethyl-2-thiouridine-forming methyltransferase MnmC
LYDTGFANGLKEGKESAVHECSVLKATNEALHQRICQLLEQSAGSATGHLIAAETAASFVVENQQLKNKVASLELINTSHVDELANTKRFGEEQLAATKRVVEDQAKELAATKRIVEDQARELATLRASSAQLLGIYSPASSAQRHGGSSYLRRPEQPR